MKYSYLIFLVFLFVVLIISQAVAQLDSIPADCGASVDNAAALLTDVFDKNPAYGKERLISDLVSDFPLPAPISAWDEFPDTETYDSSLPAVYWSYFSSETDNFQRLARLHFNHRVSDAIYHFDLREQYQIGCDNNWNECNLEQLPDIDKQPETKLLFQDYYKVDDGCFLVVDNVSFSEHIISPSASDILLSADVLSLPIRRY